MADVELVIKIPKAEYDLIKKSDNSALADFVSKEAMMFCIKNGTPLPKGHGELKDVSDIEWAKFTRENSFYQEVECVDWDVIEDAPTIIEADKAESEE